MLIVFAISIPELSASVQYGENETLKEAGLESRVESVRDDKERGMVVELSAGDSDEVVQGLLGQFVQPWERK